MRNPSISHNAFLQAFEGSGSITQAIAAALLTTGRKHAPITEARGLLNIYRRDSLAATRIVQQALMDNVKIPGLGNSFYKDEIDPLFMESYEVYNKIHK